MTGGPPLRSGDDLVVATIREGDVQGGSWVYAWVRVEGDLRVVYVGATGLHPMTRAWLHLHHDDPSLGRVRALLPQAATEPFDVLAVRVPPHVARAAVKTALIARLAGEGLLSDAYVGDLAETPADAVAAEHANLLVRAIGAHVERGERS
jgi:hypothetical protein